MHLHASGRSTDGIDEDNDDESESYEDEEKEPRQEAFVTEGPPKEKTKAPEIDGDITTPRPVRGTRVIPQKNEEAKEKKEEKKGNSEPRGVRIRKPEENKVQEALNEVEKPEPRGVRVRIPQDTKTEEALNNEVDKQEPGGVRIRKPEETRVEEVIKEIDSLEKSAPRGFRITTQKPEEKIVLQEVDEMTKDALEKVELTDVDESTERIGLKGKIKKIEKLDSSRISTSEKKLGPIERESEESPDSNSEEDEEAADNERYSKEEPKEERVKRPPGMIVRKVERPTKERHSGQTKKSHREEGSEETVKEEESLEKEKKQKEKKRRSHRKSVKKVEDSEKKAEKSEDSEKNIPKAEAPGGLTKSTPREDAPKKSETQSVVEPRAEESTIVDADDPLEAEKQKALDAKRRQLLENRDKKIQSAIVDSKKSLEKEKQKEINAKRRKVAENKKSGHKKEKILESGGFIVGVETSEKEEKTPENSTAKLESAEKESAKPLNTIVSSESVEKQTPMIETTSSGVSAEIPEEADYESSEEEITENEEDPETKRKIVDVVEDAVSLVGPPEDEDKSAVEETKKERTTEALVPMKKVIVDLTTVATETPKVEVTTGTTTTSTVKPEISTRVPKKVVAATTPLPSRVIKTRLEITKKESSTETTDSRGVRLIKTSSGSIVEMAPRGTRKVVQKKKTGPVIIIKPKNQSSEGSEEAVNRRTKKMKKVHKLKRVRVVHRNRNTATARDLPTGSELNLVQEETKEVVKKEEKQETQSTAKTVPQYVTAPGERTAAPGVTLPPEASRNEDGLPEEQVATDWDTFATVIPPVVEQTEEKRTDYDYSEFVLTTLTTTESLTSTNQTAVTNRRIVSSPVEPSGYEMQHEPVVVNSPELPPIKPEEAVGYDGIEKPAVKPLEEFRADVPQPPIELLANSLVKPVFKTTTEKPNSAETKASGWTRYRFDCETEEDDKGPLCKEWALGGLCEQHKPTMFLFCRKTCLCTGPLARRRREALLQ